MHKIALQDLNHLEAEPAWEALKGEWEVEGAELVQELALTYEMAAPERAYNTGRLEKIRELLQWVDRRREEMRKAEAEEKVKTLAAQIEANKRSLVGGGA